MPRPLRFIPEDGALVEVTTRCIQGRFLLTPSPPLNEIILGVLARAAGVMDYPDLAGVRRFMLVTRDAHELYRPFGFSPLAHPERHMEIARPGVYKKV